MAWQTVATINTSNYGNTKLQYDNSSSGTSRTSRVIFELNSGSSIYVYFNNFTVNGTNYGNKLVTGSTTLWEGSLPAGDRTVSYTCPWYSGSVTYSGTGYIPSGDVAPYGLAVTVASKTHDSITFNVSLSSYGVPSSANGRYIAANVYHKDLDAYGGRYHIENTANNTTSATLTVNNSSVKYNTSDSTYAITITGNTTYSYGGFASNTALEQRIYHKAGVTTPCPPLSAFKFSSQVYASPTTSKATMSWTRASDGGALARTGYYRVSTDNGSTYGGWISLGTITANSGTFNITVATSKNVKVQMKLTTSAGDSSISTAAFTSLATATAPAAPTISASSVAASRIDVAYGTSSFGTPSSGTVSLYGGTSENPTGLIASKTSTGNSTVNHTSLAANTRYYFRAIAKNSQLSSAYSNTSACTRPSGISEYDPTPTAQAYKTYSTVNATIRYKASIGGGALPVTGYYRYSSDGGTTYSDWVSFGDIKDNNWSTFDAVLPTSSSITLQIKTATSAGDGDEIKTMAFDTKSTHTAPNFNDFAYEDANPDVVAVTKDSSVFVQNQSTPRIIVATENKATANDGATMTNYVATLNSESVVVAYSDSEDVAGTFFANRPTASGSLPLSVSAVDALGLSTKVTKTVTVAPWAEPTLETTAARVNGFENTTTITAKGVYSPIKAGEVAKNTLTVTYRYKQHNSDTWSDWTSRPVIIEDERYHIADLSLSFDNNYQWDIQVRTTDAFSSTTVDLLLPIGRPIFFVDEAGRVSVNRKPTNREADLDVDGFIYSQDQPVMTSHVGMIIFSKTLTTADEVKAIYGGYWTSDNSFSASGVYCWRRMS